MNKYFGEWYFEDIISKINEFKLGTKIRSERGDVYNLSQAEGIGKQRKFSRWNGTKLRFMTYDNIGKKFEILEDNTEEKSNFEDMGYEIAQAYFEFYKGIAKALTEKRKESEDK